MTLHPDDITFAARVMTDIEPPSDLEERIKARLNQDTSRARPRWRPAYWVGAAGLTAAAALLALLVVEGPTPSTVQGPADVTVQGPTGSTVQSSIEVRDSQGPGSTTPSLSTSAPIRLPAYRTMSASELAWMSRAVPALDVIDPIQPEPVSIAPLTMTPLMTSPMVGDPDEGRQ